MPQSELVYTLPVFFHRDRMTSDLLMAERCLSTLQESDDVVVVLYNQGCSSAAELRVFLQKFPKLRFVLLGEGVNVGIPSARQQCFNYIWQELPATRYIAEIHLDMAFPRNWHIPLLEFLDSSDEPSVSPGIVTGEGHLIPTKDSLPQGIVPDDPGELQRLLESLRRDEVAPGAVHPIIHRAATLREVGGYDCRFLTGKQGYEDDSLLLGYLYYMGLRTAWKPKCCLRSWVYHKVNGQRGELPEMSSEHQTNLMGLAAQYGGYGFTHLAKLYEGTHRGSAERFRTLSERARAK